MNQSSKDSLKTVDAEIEDIITGMPFEDRVRTANIDENGVSVLQLALGKYLRQLLNSQPQDVNEELFRDCIMKSGHLTLSRTEAALYILRELLERLRDTHKLRIVK